MSKKQSGNALIFILIAIVLLGLLTISLTKSSSDSNDTGEYEQNEIVASEILNYAKSLENAVQSLLARGCSENEISFDNTFVTGYENLNSPGDKSCHVFDVAGMGMSYRAPKEEWLDKTKSALDLYGELYFTGNSCISAVGNNTTICKGTNSRDEELILVIPYLKKDMCEAINHRLDISGNPKDSVNMWGAAMPKYTGSFTDEAAIASNPASDYAGKSIICMEGGGNPPAETYHLIYTLIAR